MEKSIFTNEYAVVLKVLKQIRQAAQVSQVELANRIGQSQSFVSKIEVGERRLDIIQLRTICHALGTTLVEFVSQLEDHLETAQTKNRK